MAKEMNQKREGRKTIKISEYVRRGIDKFLSVNAEDYGITYVDEVILSEDCRNARIFIATSENIKSSHEISKLLKTRMRDIVQFIKREYNSKYFPQISFNVKDEENNI